MALHQSSPGTSTLSYDAFGLVLSMTKSGALSESASYSYDAASQGIAKAATIGANAYTDRWYRMGGVNMWHYSNRYNLAPGDADIASSRYTVRSGDSLPSVALAIWGDGSLWYKLAEANGLSASSSLSEGQSLIVPTGVWRNNQTAATYIPYDAGRFIGSTDASPAYPTPTAGGKRGKCGVFGQILLVAIAIAVTAITAGSGAPLWAQVGASMLGSAVSQGIGVALGIQDRFSFKAVALAGVAALVGGGIGEIAKTGQLGEALGSIGRKLDKLATGAAKVVGDVVRGALSSALTQGASVATGLQKRFDWTGVAAAGIGSGVAGAVSRSIGGQASVNSDGSINPASTANQIGSTMADAIAQAATRSIIKGSDFGDNLLASLPSAIGNLAGRALAGASGIKPLINGRASSTDGGSGDAAGTPSATKGNHIAAHASASAADNGGIVVTAARQSSGIDYLGDYSGYSRLLTSHLAYEALQMRWVAEAKGEAIYARRKADRIARQEADFDPNAPIIVTASRKSNTGGRQVAGYRSIPGGTTGYTSLGQYVFEAIQKGVNQDDLIGFLRGGKKGYVSYTTSYTPESFATSILNSDASPWQIETRVIPFLQKGAAGKVDKGWYAAALKQVQGEIDYVHSVSGAKANQLVFAGLLGPAAIAGAPVLIPVAADAAAGYYGGSWAAYYGTTVTLGGASGYGLGYGRDYMLGAIKDRTWGTVVADTGGGALFSSIFTPAKMAMMASRIGKDGAYVIAGSVSSGGSNAMGQLTDIVIGNPKSFNWWKFGGSTIAGGAAGWLGGRVEWQLSGISSGRGNWASNFQGVNTRIDMGLASRYSWRTGIRGGFGEFVRDVPARAIDKTAEGANEIILKRAGR